MSYQCNCGQVFDSPEERLAHGSSCSAMTEAMTEQELIQKSVDNKQPVRPSVFEFAKAMEAKLETNDHKGGWGEDKCSIEYLEYRLMEEIGEYFAIRAKGGVKSYFNVEPELVDVANFAMMLYQRMLGNEELCH